MEKNQKNLIGSHAEPNVRDFSNDIAIDDHKISYYLKYARNKNVLDWGCVEHNPENYRGKYWTHKALKSVARNVTGLDLYEDGCKFLENIRYNVYQADVQKFSLNKKFDVIVCGDIIEHLENFDGFIECCKEHLEKGGDILISTPNPWYWRNVLKAAFFLEVSNNPEHTCWYCLRTLRQALFRHDLVIADYKFGSRYLRDRLLPLPRGLRHTSFHVAVRRKDE